MAAVLATANLQFKEEHHHAAIKAPALDLLEHLTG